MAIDKTMTAREFADTSFCNIDIVKEGQYGLYPYQLLAFTKDDKLEVNALAVDDVRQAYDRCVHYMMDPDNELMLMALDFPGVLDIPHDFVALYTIRNFPEKDMSVIALPYNKETGERYPIIESGKALDMLFTQIGTYLLTVMNRLLKENEPLTSKIMRERKHRY